MNEKTKIGVIGAGSWGTAIANLLALKGFKVDLWAYEEKVVSQIKEFRQNKEFLPSAKLSDNINPLNDLYEAAKDKDFIIMVVPSHAVRKTLSQLKGKINKETVIVTASKGIEYETGLTMSDVLTDIFSDIDKNRFAVISGPSFAKEVAAKIPTAVVAAANDIDIARKVQRLFATPYFRVYTNTDIIGVELCGAVKNVIAIASGIISGMKNTRAALITRGITEIKRLGIKLGANPDTFIGLAGIGDLILTCTGKLSRNFTVGRRIGEGEKLKDITASTNMVAEGVENTKSVYHLSQKLDVNMPISHAVYNVLYNDVSPNAALMELMTRTLKDEAD